MLTFLLDAVSFRRHSGHQLVLSVESLQNKSPKFVEVLGVTTIRIESNDHPRTNYTRVILTNAA